VAATIEHEALRFRQMTTRQLWTRLNKIRDRSKLRLFADMAVSYFGRTGDAEYRRLANEAERRLHYPALEPQSIPSSQQDALRSRLLVDEILAEPECFADGLIRDDEGVLIRQIRMKDEKHSS